MVITPSLYSHAHAHKGSFSRPCVCLGLTPIAMVDGRTVAKLEAESKRNSSETTQEDEVSDAALAQWWLEYVISRKETKRNCMTFPHR